MKDIAHDLGISLMTVSKALRNHSDVSEETRERVLRRARELDYQPNLIARGLASRQTFLIGLIVPEIMHSFFAEVAKGVSDKLEPEGYQIVISNSQEQAARELQQVRLLMARSVDGLIIASASESAAGALTDALTSSSTKYVLIDRKFEGLDANYVGAADEEIGYLATSHLIEQGCRRIAHIRGPAISTGTGRWRGHLRALEEHGVQSPPEYVVSGGEYDDDGGYSFMLKLLKMTPRPDGVVCYNDPVATGAIRAILESGLNVPHDVAIIGAGNVHYSDLLRVPLSTIDQNSLLIGHTAAGLLLDSMRSKSPIPPRRILLTPRLVVRESTQRLAR